MLSALEANYFYVTSFNICNTPEKLSKMPLSSDVREQLMSLAGISDPADFDRLVRDLAPQVMTSDAAGSETGSATGERVGIGAPEMANMVRKLGSMAMT